ncbi:hypothetical protein ACIBO2_32415 [Nonomuraea sp. NPDC050022]
MPGRIRPVESLGVTGMSPVDAMGMSTAPWVTTRGREAGDQLYP